MTDERGSFPAKVGSLSLLAALILEGLHDMRGGANASHPSRARLDEVERYNYMYDFLVEAWNGALPLHNVEMEAGDGRADVIPAPPPRLARLQAAGDEFRAYDIVQQLQDQVDGPAEVARFAQKATRVLTLLRDVGIAAIDGEDELFLTSEFEPFLERLAAYSEEIIHRQLRGANLFTA